MVIFDKTKVLAKVLEGQSGTGLFGGVIKVVSELQPQVHDFQFDVFRVMFCPSNPQLCAFVGLNKISLRELTADGKVSKQQNFTLNLKESNLDYKE